MQAFQGYERFFKIIIELLKRPYRNIILWEHFQIYTYKKDLNIVT